MVNLEDEAGANHLMTGLDRRILAGCLFCIAILAVAPLSHGETLSDLLEKSYIAPLPEAPEAPDFILPSIDGNQTRLKDLRGRVVLLNFWATWCGPCRQEMPSMERLHQHFKGQDLSVVAVSVDMTNIESLKAFVEKHKYTFTILHDPRGRVMEAFRVRLIPVSYLINRSGRVVGAALGFRDWSDPSMIRLFEELLKKSEKAS